MPHKLFLTTRQINKERNTFDNNKSTDVKLNKAQISKIIQSGRSFGFWSSKLGNDALTTIAIPFS